MVRITNTLAKSIVEKAAECLPPELGRSLREHVLAALPKRRVMLMEIGELGRMVSEWLTKNNLGNVEAAQSAISKLQNELAPLLEQSLQENEPIDEALNRRFPKPMERKPVDLNLIGKGPEVMQYGEEMLASRVPELATKIAELADLADAEGLMGEADRLSAALPRMGLLKLAQYEGVQHYWLQNGRAFEKAWREKRKLKATDDTEFHGNDPEYYRSAHECWWETLEEYQDSLNGNHEEWLSKYAAKKDKKEEEEASMGGDGSATMSKAMQEHHKKMEEQGKTPGQGIVEWLNEQNKKAAGRELVTKISQKIEEGSSPGVAFYSAMEEMLDGKYCQDILSDISQAIDGVKKAARNEDTLQKAAQVGDFLKDMWTGIKGHQGWGGGATQGRWRTGPLVSLVQQMRKSHADVARFLNSVRKHGVPKDVFEKAIRPVLNPYMTFLAEAKKKNYPLNYPDLRMTWAGKDFIDPKTIEQFISNFDSVMTDLNEELAVAIQNTKAPVDKGKPQEEKPAEPAQEYADEMYATPEEAARAVHPEADTSDEPKTLPFPLEQPKPSYEDLVAEVTKLREELKKVRRPWG